MPNWCQTDIAMVGTKENATKLYNDVMSLLETDRKGTTKDNWSYMNQSEWLGYVVQELLGKSWQEVDCRGTIEHVPLRPFPSDDGRYVFQMYWKSAWRPCYQLQKELAAKYDLELYFLAEKTGCSLYETNDWDGLIFPACYKWGVDYYASFESLAAGFIAEYGGEVRDPEHLKERMENEVKEDEYGDCYNYFNVCKLVDDDGVFLKE